MFLRTAFFVAPNNPLKFVEFRSINRFEIVNPFPLKVPLNSLPLVFVPIGSQPEPVLNPVVSKSISLV